MMILFLNMPVVGTEGSALVVFPLHLMLDCKTCFGVTGMSAQLLFSWHHGCDPLTGWLYGFCPKG